MAVKILTREEFSRITKTDKVNPMIKLSGFTERDYENFAKAYTQTTPARSLASQGYGWRNCELEPFRMSEEWKTWGYIAP